MGKQPAAVLIARHGPRLDQADRKWRTSADRPYDTPLSYGGWLQCQKLGHRIASELESLDQGIDDEASGEDPISHGPRPQKRRKVIVHSSPFLRCVQTSIAIAAGIRQAQQDRARPMLTPFQRSSSLTRPPMRADGDRSPSLGANGDSKHRSTLAYDRPELRLDPFLGEWLNAGYFEGISKPPSSQGMMSMAKEDLQKPAEEIKGADLPPPIPEIPMSESALGGYDEEREDSVHPLPTHEKGGLRAMAAAGHSLPHRARTTSFGRDMMNSSPRSTAEQFRRRGRAGSYSPPVPTYSLAPQDPIPIGYVAHARDACVDMDLDWDSTGLDWGDGGEFDEEWSSMHHRFRNGLQKMLEFYGELHEETLEDDDDDLEEREIVLVLVTHQAGANALLRLLTGAPALHDIGTASLTLAVRRPVLRRQPSLNNTGHSPLVGGRVERHNTRRGSIDLGLADDFEMRIIASTEHLRSGSSSLGHNSPRAGYSPGFGSRRAGTGSESLENFSIGDSLNWKSSNDRSMRRGSSMRSNTMSVSDASLPAIGTGLWGQTSRKTTLGTDVSEDDDSIMPMSPKSRPSTPPSEALTPLATPLATPGTWQSLGPSLSTTTSNSHPLSNRSSSASLSSGLWGSSPAIEPVQSRSSTTYGSSNRSRSPGKRRWTAVDASP